MQASPDPDPDDLVELFTDVARRIREALDGLADWGRADGHDSQYHHDVVADDVAIPMLVDAGLGVVSEESSPHSADRQVVAVIDPIDGSTNASMALPWFATSICAVDEVGPLAAVVVNQALGVVYSAVRGQGARRDGATIAPTACSRFDDAIIVLNDLPPRRLRWRQFRAMGAAALDMCAVADGTFDCFVDFGVGLAPWDYLGALLICTEAGATVWGVDSDRIVSTDPAHRVRIGAAATSALATDMAADVH